MSNLDQDPMQWMKELFEYENCTECGGDENHHDAIPFFGNWFARCRPGFAVFDEEAPGPILYPLARFDTADEAAVWIGEQDDKQKIDRGGYGIDQVGVE